MRIALINGILFAVVRHFLAAQSGEFLLDISFDFHKMFLSYSVFILLETLESSCNEPMS